MSFSSPDCARHNPPPSHPLPLSSLVTISYCVFPKHDLHTYSEVNFFRTKLHLQSEVEGNVGFANHGVWRDTMPNIHLALLHDAAR